MLTVRSIARNREKREIAGLGEGVCVRRPLRPSEVVPCPPLDAGLATPVHLCCPRRAAPATIAHGRMNTLFYGDNLDVLRQHLDDASVDLVYLDPPFQSGRDYNVIFESHHGERGD